MAATSGVSRILFCVWAHLYYNVRHSVFKTMLHIILKALFSTTVTLLSCFFCHNQHSFCHTLRLEPVRLGQPNPPVLIRAYICILIYFSLLFTAITSAHEITQLKVPLYADPRQAAELSCHFSMDDQRLHSVKWYRDMNEIFRYNPSQKVSLKPG